jgi:hypothetical protein
MQDRFWGALIKLLCGVRRSRRGQRSSGHRLELSMTLCQLLFESRPFQRTAGPIFFAPS